MWAPGSRVKCCRGRIGDSIRRGTLQHLFWRPDLRGPQVLAMRVGTIPDVIIDREEIYYSEYLPGVYCGERNPGAEFFESGADHGKREIIYGGTFYNRKDSKELEGNSSEQ